MSCVAMSIPRVDNMNWHGLKFAESNTKIHVESLIRMGVSSREHISSAPGMRIALPSSIPNQITYVENITVVGFIIDVCRRAPCRL